MGSGQWLVGSGGFEISLQRYYIFGQVVGNVLPIITGGCNFSSDWSGRTRAGAVGFEISLQRYYIFLPFVGQVRPKRGPSLPLP